MPLLSVIIPVYNGMSFIEKTISNVIGQTFGDFELLLINDGSKDDSFEIMNRLSETDKRIKVFTKNNEGICATRNYGIKKSQGKYLIFLDQDDDFDALLFEDYVNTIQKNAADMCVFGRTYTIIYKNGNVRQSSIIPQSKELIDDRKILFNHIFNFNNDKTFQTIWNCIYKRDIIVNNNILFDARLKHGYEDTLFNMQYASKCERIYLSPNIHYHYQLRHGISTISKENDYVLDDFELIANETFKLIPNNDIHDYCSNIYGFYLLRLMQVPYIRQTRHNKMNFRQRKNILIHIINNVNLKHVVNCSFNNSRILSSYKAILKLLQISIRFNITNLSVVLMDCITTQKK